MVYNKTQPDQNMLPNEKNTFGKCNYRKYNQVLIPMKKSKPLY